MQVTATSTLWNHRDFVKLWIGQTISELGSRITREACHHGASYAGRDACANGLHGSVERNRHLVFGLPVGVWVDRVRRKPVMIGADIARALLLLSVPLAAWQGALRLPQLYAVAVLTGILSVCFDVAYQSYVPSLVDRERILEANSKLALSSATAEIAGPASLEC